MTTYAKTVNMTTTNTTWLYESPANESGQDTVAAAPGTSGYHVYVTLVVYPIVFLFGVFGNTLVITVVVKYSTIRNKSISNYYILNLAAADELLLLTVPFFCVSTYTSDWVFGEVVCKLSYVFRESNKYTGILTLVALSVDRCLASYHDTAILRSIPVGIGVCVGVWLVSLLACLPFAINSTVTVAHAGHRSCRFVWRLTTEARRAWTYLQLVLGLVVPLIVIAAANVILLWRLRRRSAKRLSSMSSVVSGSATGCHGVGSGNKPTYRPTPAVKLVLAVVGVFVACQLPYHVVEVMSLITFERYSAYRSAPSDTFRTVFVYVNTAAQLLVYVSSCCNPIIYGIFNKNYRHLYAKTLCCKSTITDASSSVTSRRRKAMSDNNLPPRRRTRLDSMDAATGSGRIV